MEVNNDHIISRHNVLREAVEKYLDSGMFHGSQQLPISPETLDLIERTQKDAVSLVSIYCASAQMPSYQFHVYDFPGGSGRYTMYHKVVTKAKQKCALRLLDFLMMEQKLGCITERGKKVRRSSRLKQSVVKEHDFSMDVNTQQEFEDLNPAPVGAKNPEHFVVARTRAYNLYSSSQLVNEETVGLDIKIYLESLDLNPITFVCQNSHPDFFTFILPGHAPHNFVTLAFHNGEIYAGASVPSKQGSKSSCALVIAERMIKSGQILGKKRARESVNAKPAAEASVDDDGPSLKKLKFDDLEQFFVLPQERLDAKTVYHVIINSKNPVTILQEHCQKNRLSPPVFTSTVTNLGKYTVEAAVGPTSAKGLSISNKKHARASASRALLNAFVIKGELKVEEGMTFPIDISITSPSASVFDYFRTVTYQEFQKAYQSNPLFAYSNSCLASIFIVDVHNRTANVVSWATGNYLNTSIYPNGNALNDCDAIILCRRGLLRFLYEQVQQFVDGTQKATESLNCSIFVRDNANSLLRLRSHLSFHMYMSCAPSGSSTISRSTNQTAEHQEPVWQHPPFDAASVKDGNGVLAIKSSKGKSDIVCSSSSSAEPLQSQHVYLSMSTSDKILKWNLLGVQGALLGRLVEPIYIQSFGVEGNYSANAISQAIVGRNSLVSLPSTAPFTSNQPYIAPVKMTPFRKPEVEELARQHKICLNWNAANANVEIVNPMIGCKASGGESRLSKRQIFDRFRKVASSFDLPVCESYREAKALNKEYSKILAIFKESLQSNGLGFWVDKSSIPDFKID